jgi:hypothetical protein
MDHEHIGQLLNNMTWFVLTSTDDSQSFLTSDRPVVISESLVAEKAYVLLPCMSSEHFGLWFGNLREYLAHLV